MLVTTWELITPELAAQYLATNTVNRPLKDLSIGRFAADMLAGKWRPTHQGIAFYTDGRLADGQHRLHAVIRSGVSVYMAVTRGLPVDAALVIDGVVTRTARDCIQIGALVSTGEKSSITSEVIATARVLMSFLQEQPRAIDYISVPQVQDYCAHYEEGIRDVIDTSRPRRSHITHRVLWANVYAAAYRGESEKRLVEFLACMTTGQVNSDEDNAALRLREWMLTNPVNPRTPMATSLRIQNALRAFLRRAPIAKLYAAPKLSWFAPPR